jgi:toxin FitB
MYLLDTVVLSELRKPRADANVAAWIASVPADEVYVSVLTLAEIEAGIERQNVVNPTFAAELARWQSQTMVVYGDRILPVTVGIGRRWGKLVAQIGHRGFDLGIAATALEHGLTVVTRNVADFVTSGVATLNPFRPGLHERGARYIPARSRRR